MKNDKIKSKEINMLRISIFFTMIIMLFVVSPVKAQEGKVTNELIYRELKIFETKTEEISKAVDQRFNALDQRFDDVNKRIDDLYTFLWILTAIFMSISGVAISLAFWDRKTSVEMSVKKSIEKIEKEGLPKQLLDVLRELSKDDQKVANVLKQFKLL